MILLLLLLLLFLLLLLLLLSILYSVIVITGCPKKNTPQFLLIRDGFKKEKKKKLMEFSVKLAGWVLDAPDWGYREEWRGSHKGEKTR